MLFRPAEVVKLYCVFHRERRLDVLNSLQCLGLVEFFDVKDVYPDLEEPPTSTLDIARERNRATSLLKEATPYARETTFLEKVLGPKSEPLVLRPRKTSEILKETRKRLDFIEREFQALKGKAKDYFRSKYRFELQVLQEELENAYERMRAVEKFGATRDTLTLGCWVERDNVMKVARTLERATEDACVITLEMPRRGEPAPVALQNPGILKPYELLSKAYGLPRYRELDPTPILAFTFTLFFGIMFADVGYGLLIMLLGAVVFMNTRKTSEAQRNINMLVIYGGSASVVFGFLFGEFFGGLIHLGPRFIGSDIIMLLERLMVLTISVGVVHISISLVSRLTSAMLSKEDLLYPASLLMVLWASAGMAIAVLESLPSWSLFLSQFFMAVGLLLLFKTKGAEAIVELMALFTNIVSYIRIAVILLFHVVVARLLYDTVYGIPRNLIGLVIGIIAFTSGAALILSMGVFMTFIQSLRLHWLEFFRRFYSGTGESFKYFSRKSKYTHVC